ncbi:MAG: winged helix-turn-helix domain-containing protein, partial [Bifidobacterium crudilactis]|nr:winged helix-turn-helix domain-containing protein [Bifidobacterium crudilactis]
MTMPTYEGFMVPVLQLLADGTSQKLRDLTDLVADAVGLTEAEQTELYDSGQVVYRNRIGWAASYLNTYGMVTKPNRGVYVITAAGRELLAASGDKLTTKELVTYAKAHGTMPVTESDDKAASSSAAGA